ncbi:MAG: DUF2203 domain-containing protein [Candidatus Omnitrophica bacterium]|nr:DUF2203 domain-containing protein [Candidatus Omnitrophota bacterium]
MDNELRTFTVEEANRIIPDLTKLIRLLQAKQKQALDLEVQIDALELIAEQKSKKSVTELSRLVKAHHERVTEFYAVVDQIHQQGCLLKDINMGLIDFYSIMNGKVIYLCWRLGEEKVNFWHEVGQGYAFRHPLTMDPNDVQGGESASSEQ